jgi:LacI family transcriptional regulator
MQRLFKGIPRVLVALTTVQKAHQDKLQGILKYARLNGPWEVQTLDERSYITKLGVLKTWRPDGIIARDMDEAQTALGTVRMRKFPLVVLDAVSPCLRNCFSVSHNPRSISDPVADFYMQQGFRNFAFVDTVPPAAWSAARADAFANRLAQNGHVCAVYTPTSTDDWGIEQKHMRKWLLSLPKPCGLLAALDLQAKRVLDVCLNVGIRVPEDIAIIGVDNDEVLCENTTPTLSSVLPDFEGGGYMAAELLDRLMRGGKPEPAARTYGIKRIVHRQSSRHNIHARSRLAAAAIEFIRLNACAGITVADVARHLKVSRRLAELRFRETCGRSILEEIQFRRLDRVCALLRETSLTMGEISERCSYQAETYLKVLFKKRFGMTMTEFRRNG